MNHSKQHYEKYAKIAHDKYMAAINIGEDKEAAKQLASYEDYQEMLKALKPTS